MTTFSKSAFTAWDSVAAAQSEQWDAAFMKARIRNGNLLTADLVQPVYAQSYEVADPRTGGNTTSVHSLHVNAPPGSWTTIIPPHYAYVPPGTEELEISIRAKVPNGENIYLQFASEKTPFNGRLDTSAINVATLAGSGGAKSYPISGTWRVPITPGPAGRTFIQLFAQTTKFTQVFPDTASGVVGARDSLGFYDSSGTGVFGSPTELEAKMDDWWYRIYEREAVYYATTEDNSGASFAAMSNINNPASTDRPFPYGPTTAADDDAAYFGFESSQFDGLMFAMDTYANWTGTAAWEYNTAADWSTTATFDELMFTITDWTGPKGSAIVLWQPATGWVRSDPSGTGNTAFYARSRLTATPTFNTTEPLIDRAWILRAGAPFGRVISGTAESDSRIDVGSPRGLASIRDDSIYLVGRAQISEIHAINVMPVAASAIT